MVRYPIFALHKQAETRYITEFYDQTKKEQCEKRKGHT